jgi:hypothetical protein
MAAFYCDENVDMVVAALLNEAGHVASTTVGDGRVRAWDPDHLRYATDQRCILVTHNRRDFRTLHDAWMQWSPRWREQQPHGGMVILDQGYPATVIVTAIQNLLATMSEPIAGRTFDWFARDGGAWTQWRP